MNASLTGYGAPLRIEPLSRAIERTAATRLAKGIVLFGLVSISLLDRFGIYLSPTFSIRPAMFALYGLAAVLLLSGAAIINLGCALAFVLFATISAASLVTNTTLDSNTMVSASSWVLLVALYAPFAVTSASDTWIRPLAGWVLDRFLVFMMVLAAFGIVQFYGQYVYHASWLFDYTPNIPKAIRSSGTYVTTNVIGEHIKANGFFLREASGFSLYMALALLCELETKKRKWAILLFLWGTLVAYSGSGPAMLVVAAAFPLNQKTISRMILLATVAIGAFFALESLLNLSFLVNRLNEFNSPKSSAYCRFVAPTKLSLDLIDATPWSALIGHGPGTTTKMLATCETTFAKAFFEYGILGIGIVCALVIAAIKRSALGIRVKVALFFQWLVLGGNLLSPDSLFLLYLLSAAWPRPDAAKPAEEARAKSIDDAAGRVASS